MNRPAPILAALAVTAGLLAAGCTDDPAPTAAGEPTPATTSSAAPFTPVPEEGEEILPAGRWGLTVAENVLPHLPWAVVDTPAGFSHFANWILSDAEHPRADLSYWTLHAVREDPCKADAVAVDTAEEAAEAFQAQRRSKVSQPRPVTLDGYQGLYLELQVPEETNFATCPRYHPWDIDAADDGLPYLQSPGRQRLWILDLDSDLAVIMATDDEAVPAEAREQLTEMVESIDFVARR